MEQNSVLIRLIDGLGLEKRDVIDGIPMEFDWNVSGVENGAHHVLKSESHTVPIM